MAISLNLSDTHIVLSALQVYREEMLELAVSEGTDEYDADLEDVERLIKSYKRSFAALERLKFSGMYNKGGR
jgi:hypothetical protein